MALFFKENIIIQSLKFTLYLIWAKKICFFPNFCQTIFLFYFVYFVSIFVHLTHRATFLKIFKINSNFLSYSMACNLTTNKKINE